jgi:2-polyprenyl-3-methyl-5-hydroxy-6-metoxy-1,4-benzoquinol methylase
MSRSKSSRPGFAVTIGRAVLWPLRRFFDPRFSGLARQGDVQHDDIRRRLDTLVETVQAESNRNSEALEQHLSQLRDEVNTLAQATMDLMHGGGSVEHLHARSAELLNYASSHRGFAAQEGLWFNPPLSLSYEQGRVRLGSTNERIVEVPYVYRALGATAPGSSILDVGAAESMLAFSLASLGYDVTALDIRGYSLEHPRLRVVESDILQWKSSETFDAVLCVSTLEHIGLDVYDAEVMDGAADQAAIERIRALVRPGGIFVLTVPFGPESGDETQRSYDRTKLERLLANWTVKDLTIVRQEDDLTWSTDAGGRDGDAAERRVALITALRSPER